MSKYCALNSLVATLAHAKYKLGASPKYSMSKPEFVGMLEKPKIEKTENRQAPNLWIQHIDYPSIFPTNQQPINRQSELINIILYINHKHAVLSPLLIIYT